ncbi:decarboxylase [Streptosporangium nondiastaticum]|uniref:Decarboxylase n=1 Tax=Streptosporangium nondiastaticum TaxID=35764 RepID=A0A9X7PG18_9ACTN|nr:pyridoxal-dependent decarboxylase [Streptosporangium nondiastaticum]PSJ26634.1 decarboxylase [Streptosporangium nondiastaticum]
MADDRTNAAQRAYLKALERRQSHFDLTDAPGTSTLAAWFLGPKAENADLLKELVEHAVSEHAEDRQKLYPEDPPYVTEDMKLTDGYQQDVKHLRSEFDHLLRHLRGSVPAWSYRFQGHMNWDVTLPGIAGYLAGMLYNPNNVAVEASPVTTLLEKAVGEDLCRLLGYDDQTSWGHITCDGTVANLEAAWSARNLTYHPVAVAEAIRREPALAAAGDLVVPLADGTEHPLLELTPWQLVNLQPHAVLDLSARVRAACDLTPEQMGLIDKHTIQNLGYDHFRRYLKDDVEPGVILASATMHYSWPKAAALLGIGRDGIRPVGVDLDARAATQARRALLDECLLHHRPVLLDVAIVGSTELSAVDPLTEILDLRDEYARRGLCYPIHADSAWGGYFAAIKRPHRHAPHGNERPRITPDLAMSAYVNKQYDVLHRADSISIDPHKAGYVPYPAGGLCYRDKRQRNLIAMGAAYIDQGSDIDANMGLFGVEGSKPGAAAAGVYLSHRVIRTNDLGYGRILGQALFNSKRLYAAVRTMAGPDDPFTVATCQRIPAEHDPHPDPEAVAEQLAFIKERIVPKSNEAILEDRKARRLLKELGSDQIIIGYAFNPVVDGRPNTSLAVANDLNERIAQRLKVDPETIEPRIPRHKDMPPLIITASQFDPALHGEQFIDAFCGRLGVAAEDPGTPVTYLISTTMDPWVTDTETGDFIPTLIEALRTTVLDCMKDMKLLG